VERELVPLIREEKMGLLVWSPLAGGLLSGKFGPDSSAQADARRSKFDFPPVDREHAWQCVAEMRAIAEEHRVSVSQIALAWLLARPYVTSVIIGVKRIEQLDDNIGAADIILTAEERGRLDEVSALPPYYPGWMIEHQNAARRQASSRAQN
jgi:aryl-alcohol dehydrogenase-like predicted oxidoreductase